MINNIEKKEVGGFIIFKIDNSDGIKILCLFKHNGQIDLPKGRRDNSDQTILFTAIRETYEETNILLDQNEIISHGKQFNHMTFFIAQTNKKPEIKRNPVTNVYEHRSYAWLSPEDYIANAPKYLIKPVIWAIRKVYKK